MRLAGIEPATTGLEGRCSIQLSYRRIDVKWNMRIVPRDSDKVSPRGRVYLYDEEGA